MIRLGMKVFEFSGLIVYFRGDFYTHGFATVTMNRVMRAYHHFFYTRRNFYMTE